VLRILHVQETLTPRYGGPARVLPELARAQAAAGHEVVIATTTADHPSGVYHDPGWETLSEGATVFYGSVQYMPLLVSWSVGRWLRRHIGEYDIVNIHGLYRFPNTLATHLARRRGIPYVLVPHGSLDPYLYARSTTGRLAFKRIYERLFVIPGLRKADALQYTAEEERERTKFLDLQVPSFVIPNGLGWEPYRDLPPRGAMRERWGLGDQPIVLFLGRIHVKKGFDLLIPAFDEVRKRIPDAQLVIVGPENDDHGKDVRKWVTERGLDAAVHFVGPVVGPDVVQAYVDADVFALPSYTENFGMTVVEAMACALPVVISDQVNIHHEISAAAAGLVTQCDVGEVADAMYALLTDPERRHTMGDMGRRLVQERYSWPAIVDALTKEYEAVIERANSDR
jgi:glycosyltransferase involved in cell wall biosynthesis